MWVHGCHSMHVEVKGQSIGICVLFPHVGFGDGTSVLGIGNKLLYLLRHHIGSHSLSVFGQVPKHILGLFNLSSYPFMRTHWKCI